VGFIAFLIGWVLIGLISTPVIKSSWHIRSTPLAMLVAALIGIPVIMIGRGVYPKLIGEEEKQGKTDTEKTISSESTSNQRQWSSAEEYFRSNSIDLIEMKVALNEGLGLKAHVDVDHLYFDGEKLNEDIVLELLNNEFIPLGVLPVGCTIVGDEIGIDFRARPAKLVLMDFEDEPEITPWKESNYCDARIDT
jgi:hypothetical protein